MEHNILEPYVSAGHLNVPAGLMFTIQPHNQTVRRPGEVITLRAVALNAVDYVWLWWDPETGDWTDTGTTGDTFTLEVTAGMDGWKFCCAAVDEDNNFILSRAAVISIRDTVDIEDSGAIVTIENGPVTLSSVMVDVNATQAGSGDPSPDNIRPITGFSSVDVFRTGVNVWDEETANGYWGASGGNSDANYLRSKNMMPVKPNAKYYFNFPSRVVNLYSQGYDKDGAHGRSLAITPNSTLGFTVPSDIYYIGFAVKKDQYGSTYQNDISVNYPSTDTDYHQYNGTTYTISLGDTYYGGVLDVTTGVLTVTHGYIASYDGETLPGAWISDRDVYAEGTTPTAGAEVVYELATPIEITLTPEDITANLMGVNNVWADSGDITVTYKDWPASEDESDLLELSPLNIPDITPDIGDDLTPAIEEPIIQEFDNLL